MAESSIGKRKFSDSVFKGIFLFCAIFGILAVLVICLYLLAVGIPAIAEIGFFDFIFGTTWRPSAGKFGILPMIVNSIYVTAFALLFGVVVGVFAAVFLSRFCPKALKKPLRQAVNLLSGIPSVIYGFFGLQVIVPLLGVFTDTGSGFGLMASGLVLGIMILPTVISISLGSLDNVPGSYYEGAVALGATHAQASFKVILPAAKSGITTAAVLGITRAIGETMAVIMVCGNSSRFATSLFEGIRTMTGNIVLEMSYATGIHMDALIATGVVLFVFILMITVGFNLAANRRKKTTKCRTRKPVKIGENFVPDVFRIKRASSVALRAVSCACMCLTVLFLMSITLFVLIAGLPNLTPQLLFGQATWGGPPTILPALTATLMMIGITLAIVVPIGVFAAIYLTEYTKRGSRIVRIIRMCLETLSGIPSIVYGLFGMLVFCRLFDMGVCILAACLTLSIMILPTIVRTTEEALKEVPDSYREAGFALGAGKLRVIFLLVLPNAMSGIITSVILGMGRILGESAVIMLTSGSTDVMPTGPMSSAPNLALYVYTLSSEGFHTAEAYGVSCIVLLLAVSLNLLASLTESCLGRGKTKRARRAKSASKEKDSEVEVDLCSAEQKV